MTLPAADRAYMATLRPARDRDRLAERTATAAENMTGSSLDGLAEEVAKIEDLRCLELSMLLNRTGRAGLRPDEKARLAAEAHMRLDRPKVAASIRDVFLVDRVDADPVPAGESNSEGRVVELDGNLVLVDGELVDRRTHSRVGDRLNGQRKAYVQHLISKYPRAETDIVFDTIEDMEASMLTEADQEGPPGIWTSTEDDTLIHGGPKLGKSRLARTIADHHLAQGGPVLIVYGEDPKGWRSWAITKHREALQDGRLRMLYRTRLPDLQDAPQVGFQVSFEDLPLRGSENPEILEIQGLVIIDPVSRFISLEDGGENLKANVAAYFRHIKALWPTAQRITVQHDNKARTVSGSQEWRNTPGVVIHLRWSDDEAGVKLLEHTHRRAGEPISPVKYATGPWGISILGKVKDTRQDLILEALAGQFPRVVSYTYLKTHINGLKREELAGLERQGLLLRGPLKGAKSGGYTLPDAPTTDQLPAQLADGLRSGEPG